MNPDDSPKKAITTIQDKLVGAFKYINDIECVLGIANVKCEDTEPVRTLDAISNTLDLFTKELILIRDSLAPIAK